MTRQQRRQQARRQAARQTTKTTEPQATIEVVSGKSADLAVTALLQRMERHPERFVFLGHDLDDYLDQD